MRKLGIITMIAAMAAIAPQGSAQGRTHEVNWWTGMDYEFAGKCTSAIRKNPKYDFSFAVNPYVLRLDINGDGRMDYAFRVLNKRNKKEGIAICLDNGKGGKLDAILYAGKKIKRWSKHDVTDNLSEYLSWHAASRDAQLTPIEEGPKRPKAKGEMIIMAFPEGPALAVYWTGKEYYEY